MGVLAEIMGCLIGFCFTPIFHKWKYLQGQFPNLTPRYSFVVAVVFILAPYVATLFLVVFGGVLWYLWSLFGLGVYVTLNTFLFVDFFFVQKWVDVENEKHSTSKDLRFAREVGRKLDAVSQLREFKPETDGDEGNNAATFQTLDGSEAGISFEEGLKLQGEGGVPRHVTFEVFQSPKTGFKSEMLTLAPLSGERRRSIYGSSSGRKNNLVIFLIPGCPGPVDYYLYFAIVIWELCKGAVKVVVVGHVGHSTLELNGDRSFTFEEQVDAKIEIMESIMDKRPGTQFLVLAHSVGAMVANDILVKAPELPIVHSVYLFPFLRPVDTFRRVTIQVASLAPIRFFVRKLIIGLHKVPVSFRSILFSVFGNRHAPNALRITTNLRTDSQVNNFFSMMTTMNKRFDELNSDWNLDVMMQHLDNIIYYYGVGDGWAPLWQYDEIRRRFPSARLDLDGYSGHAFIRSVEEVDVVATRVYFLIHEILQSQAGLAAPHDMGRPQVHTQRQLKRQKTRKNLDKIQPVKPLAIDDKKAGVWTRHTQITGPEIDHAAYFHSVASGISVDLMKDPPEDMHQGDYSRGSYPASQSETDVNTEHRGSVAMSHSDTEWGDYERRGSNLSNSLVEAPPRLQDAPPQLQEGPVVVDAPPRLSISHESLHLGDEVV